MKAIELDINKLPSKAKKELFEYFSFLEYKYSIGKRTKNKKQNAKEGNINAYSIFLKDSINLKGFTIPGRDERNER